MIFFYFLIINPLNLPPPTKKTMCSRHTGDSPEVLYKVEYPLFWWKLLSSEIICYRRMHILGLLSQCVPVIHTQNTRMVGAFSNNNWAEVLGLFMKRIWPRDWICLLRSDGSLLRMVTRATTVLIVAPSCSSLNDFGVWEWLWDCVWLCHICWRRRWCIQWHAWYSGEMWHTVCMRAQNWASSSLCQRVMQSLFDLFLV